jgi:ABC-type phosphate/phosphonate transport system substrate-binding protein
MKNLSKISFTLLCLAFIASAVFIQPTAHAGARKESISIDILPEMNIFKQRERFQPLAVFLSTEMGIEVKL